jgi:hypothetical protein
MCLICVEFKKETLTITESWRNLREMKEGMSDEHYDEVVSMLVEAYEEERQENFEDSEESLADVLDSLEEGGQLNFEWDLRLGDDSNRDDYDTEDPWYLPGFED